VRAKMVPRGLTNSYFKLRLKVLSLEKEKKNTFFFCFLLAYSYLCRELWTDDTDV
jgi:hypothetical protein